MSSKRRSPRGRRPEAWLCHDQGDHPCCVCPTSYCERMQSYVPVSSHHHRVPWLGARASLWKRPLRLLRLAMPNVVVMVAQALVSTCEVYFIGWLGTEALAGVSLVFPLIMLMQTMSAGGMGGGVASAVARALGAGRRSAASALALHALVIAGVMGVLFTTGAFWGGPALYRAMGGEGRVLAAALTYSNVVFAGALGFWLFNILASVVRGTGNMLLPAALVIGGVCSP